MKRSETKLKNILSSYKVVVFTLIISILSTVDTSARNVVDSDMSNTAGSNLGKSHLDIYLFIVGMLVLCLVIPYWEDKQKAKKNV